MKGFEQFLSDESVLVAANGETLKGAKNVGSAIVSCCERYNQEYMRVFTRAFVKHLGLGVGIGLVGIIAIEIMDRRKLKKKSEGGA